MLEILDLALKFENFNENDSVALLKIVSIPLENLFIFDFNKNFKVIKINDFNTLNYYHMHHLTLSNQLIEYLKYYLYSSYN
jgi:hypothetical protein